MLTDVPWIAFKQASQSKAILLKEERRLRPDVRCKLSGNAANRFVAACDKMKEGERAVVSSAIAR